MCQNLRNIGYNAIVLDIFLGVPNIKNYIDYFKNYENKKYNVNENPPDIEELKKMRNPKVKGLFGENVLDLCSFADLVFIMLHGSDGENGKIQGTFDLLNIKYTGSGYLGSAIAINKDLTKQILAYNNIKTPKGILINNNNCETNLSFPVVVKPSDGGSSIGISIAYNDSEYQEAIIKALKYNNEVLIEEYIKGREFSVGILNAEVLPVIEIIPKQGFYDYENKYQAGNTVEICPADLSEEETKKLQELTLKTHNALRLNHYSRIDFIRDHYGEFYCLEANTIPGMTETSLLPQEALVAGYSFEKLCEIIINTT